MKGSSSVEYSTLSERTENDRNRRNNRYCWIRICSNAWNYSLAYFRGYTMKYCQSHKCHTYDTKDRKRGSKGNKKNQTRRRSEFYYGGGNFCSLNCYNDWANDFMDRAIDSISGRLHEPITLEPKNAWIKRRYNYNWREGAYQNMCWRNMATGVEVEIPKENWNDTYFPQPTMYD